MEQNPALFCYRGQLRKRLNRSNFVVCRHDADETGLSCDSFQKVVGIDQAVLIDREQGDLESTAPEPFTCREYSRVFYRRGNYVVFPVPVRKGCTFQYEVVRF